MRFDRMLTTLENIVIVAMVIGAVASVILVGVHLLTH